MAAWACISDKSLKRLENVQSRCLFVINDIDDRINNKMLMFLDDTKIRCTVNNVRGH